MIAVNKDIRDTSDYFEIVDCIQTKIYGVAPQEIVAMFNHFPNDKFHNYFRILCVPFLFHKTETIFKSDKDPMFLFVNALAELKKTTLSAVNNVQLQNLLTNSFEYNDNEDFETEVKSHTGQHYGNLFKEFDHKSYFDEAKKLLETRLKRNEIKITNIENLVLLDQGCGGGRYTAAWKLLGIKKAVGIDFSDIGLQDARVRAELAGIESIEFVKGSVLEMPFEDKTFDIVYSNGVLHHTEDWKKGIVEQLRVMKKGGWGWQYLIENPGGIFWDSIEILRAIMKDVNNKYAQDVLRSLGIPMNRVFYMLDHVMVPINTRITPKELTVELEKNGAINIKRLTRGADFDRVESIYNQIPFAKEKFGVGENRYIFNKK
ncbi:class I SAM-dependent methyltransferase [Flavobacterium sp.]|uniref:class I SAM-dependent methyltransferase n=1 Tax=Flavobacterium sp. TaxID=239 RepID=UPI0025D9245D|nr:class I SAM-dependent methyltransferase [Flavobacterium sp.]